MWKYATLLAVSLCLFATGCGSRPQVASGHRKLIESVLTAVSARNPQLLEENARLIGRLGDRGELTAAEQQTFEDIIARARAGDWAAAENEAYALRDAQRVTQEDVDHLPEHARG